MVGSFIVIVGGLVGGVGFGFFFVIGGVFIFVVVGMGVVLVVIGGVVNVGFFFI